MDRDPNDAECWAIVDYLVEEYGVNIDTIKYLDWSYGDYSTSIEFGGDEAHYELVIIPKSKPPAMLGRLSKFDRYGNI